MEYRHEENWIWPHVVGIEVDVTEAAVDGFALLAHLVKSLKSEANVYDAHGLVRCFNLPGVYTAHFIHKRFGDFLNRYSGDDVNVSWATHPEIDSIVKVAVAFSNKDDAMLFKLTYGGN